MESLNYSLLSVTQEKTTDAEKIAIGNSLVEALDAVNLAIKTLSNPHNSFGPNTRAVIEQETGTCADGPLPEKMIDDLQGVANELYSPKFEIELVDRPCEEKKVPVLLNSCRTEGSAAEPPQVQR